MAKILTATQSHFMLMTATRADVLPHIAPRFIGDMTSRMLEGIDDYAAGAAANDPTLAFVAANSQAVHFATHKHLDPDSPVVRRYVQWNRHYLGNAHWQARFEHKDGLLFGASLHPRSPDEPHSAEAQRMFELLFRHMARAARLAARPASLAHQPER